MPAADGEVIAIGPHKGGVMRHEPSGIAIQFIAIPDGGTAGGY